MALEEKLTERDEILYFYKVFPERDYDRAWDIVKGGLDANKNIRSVISDLQAFFNLNSFELFGLQEKFFGFKKFHSALHIVFWGEIRDINWILEGFGNNIWEV